MSLSFVSRTIALEFQALTLCTFDHAVKCLEAEEWLFVDAVSTFYFDRAAAAPKTPAQRQASRRQRLKAAQLSEVRGVFLPAYLHADLKAYASLLIASSIPPVVVDELPFLPLAGKSI
jgi:hypothetical protein